MHHALIDTAAYSRSPVPAAKPGGTLVEVARRLYRLRKRRDSELGALLFSEPAWDILLDLFISDYDDRQLSVSAVCIGARAPSATALRYLTLLQDAGLVERIRDATDGRRSHVTLTGLGRRRMTNLLAILALP
jgi:DNA-binding MarR family transcriptional regulator